MVNKRTFSEDDFIFIELKDANLDRKRPFPLYMYLPINKHLILLAHENEDLNRKTLKRLENQKTQGLWCPVEFKDVVDSYLNELDQNDEVDCEIKSEEAQIAAEVMHDENLDEAQKKAILANISQNLISNLYTIGSEDSESAEIAFDKCKSFAEDIVKVGLTSRYSKDLWDEIERIKNEVGLEHSTTTSSFAVIFAMGIGHTDPEYLTDISTAALFHDIGFVKLDFNLLSIPECEFDDDQKSQFEKHVDFGVSLLKQRQFEIPERVLEAIEQHHERFDGTGYPKGIKGFELSEMSQILAIADMFDDIMTGRFDGEEKDAKSSLLSLQSIAEGEQECNLFDPDLFGRFLNLLSLSAEENQVA